MRTFMTNLADFLISNGLLPQAQGLTDAEITMSPHTCPARSLLPIMPFFTPLGVLTPAVGVVAMISVSLG